MLTVERINELIGVKESFKASIRLMELLKSDAERDALFGSFLAWESDLSFDWFTDYYQGEHSDRKNLMQDFTPDGVIRTATGLLGSTTSNLDLCAGTGGLTIKIWSENPDATFYCEEYSERAFPFLLFNLAIRNIVGQVMRIDSLTREVFSCYTLIKGEWFSSLTESEPDNAPVDTAILNPPYSQAWNPDPDWIYQDRFVKFGALAPKSKADYAFLLTALDRLNDSGRLLAILPHGVLFRGGAEGTIRENLIRQNLLDGFVGIAPKVFLNTDIPTVMIQLAKNRPTTDVVVIDASDECKKDGKKNTIELEHTDRILRAYRDRQPVHRFANVTTFAKMEEHGFNLNIPRYVDTYVPPEITPLSELVNELIGIEEEIKSTRIGLGLMMQDLRTADMGELAAIRTLAGKYLDDASDDEISAARIRTNEKENHEPSPPTLPRTGEQIDLFEVLNNES